MSVIFIAIALYTVPVLMSEGFTLFGVFFGDILAMRWPGQFNFDFLCFLLMSAAWVAWRNSYSRREPGAFSVGLFGGAFFLSAYLLYLSRDADNLQAILLGDRHLA